MSNTVIALKKSATPTRAPTNLANGELAINYADGILYYKAANGTIASIQSLEGNSFGTVNANGTFVVSDTVGDILTVVSGNNIAIIGDAINDKMTFSLTNDVTISGNFRVLGAGNDEGGEIKLANAITNSVLVGDVTVDVYQNKLRFFEAGGTNRGAYINLAAAATSVGTDLLAAGSGVDGYARTTANQAFDKANAALPNISGAWFNGTLTASANLVADKIISTNNGNGENFKIGDDVWIGDYNASNSMRIKGQQNTQIAYISFGTGDTKSLGRDGTGPLTYDGQTIWHAGSDGAGSGLDADLLDGQHGSYYGLATNEAAIFLKANTANITADRAWNHANAAFISANIAFANANTVMISAQAAFTVANSAFLHANAAYAFANLIATTANAALPNTNGVTFNGTLTASANLVADKIIAIHNADSENFKVGDDAWIGDYNNANSIKIKGAQNNQIAYISFGTGDAKALGRAGTDNLTYDNNIIWHQGNDGTGSGLDADLLDGQHSAYFGKADDLTAAFAAANIGFAKANTANITADRAWNHANAAFAHANAAFANANTVMISAQVAFTVANSAFLHANAAYAFANSITITANLAFAHANAAFANGNTVIQTAQSAFTQANLAFIHANNAFASANAGQASGNAGQSTANASYAFANSAHAIANLAFTHANNAYNKANTANITADRAWNHANAAFDTANNALPKAGGTVTGNLAVTGSLTIQGNVYMQDAETVRISDPLLYLAGNNYSSDIVDIGFVANYVNATGQNVHTGIFRDATIKEYYLFEGYDKEPNPNHIDTAGNNFTISVLNATVKTSNLILGGVNAIATIGASFNHANAAHASANAGMATANVALARSNTLFITANGAWDKANTANITADRSWNHANAAFLVANNALPSSSYTAADVLSKLLTVDGAASGLDSDLLDGQHATYYGIATDVTAANRVANAAFLHANASYAFANSAHAATNAAFLSANTARTVVNDTISATRYLMFANGTTGTASLNVAVGLSFNPSSNTLNINGPINAVTKSFLITHPTKDGMMLRYGSLEGPENGVYVRGRVHGPYIYLPEHWLGLVDENSVTVSLTPIAKTEMPSVLSYNNEKVVLHSNSAIDCFYHIFGERKDVDKLLVEF